MIRLPLKSHWIVRWFLRITMPLRAKRPIHPDRFGILDLPTARSFYRTSRNSSALDTLVPLRRSNPNLPHS